MVTSICNLHDQLEVLFETSLNLLCLTLLQNKLVFGVQKIIRENLRPKMLWVL